MKMAKTHETCDDFCDVKKYPTAIWTCAHLCFKNIWSSKIL